MGADAGALARRHRQQRQHQRPHRWHRPAWWPRARRVAWAVFLLVTAALLVHLGRGLDWAGAVQALRALPVGWLWIAAGGVALAYAAFASYELLGRAMTPERVADAGIRLGRRWLLAVGFVTFAVKLSLGALVGGVAMRYRLYGRLGLPVETTTRLLAASLVTNWIGYVALLGGLLLWQPPALPPEWGEIARAGSGVLRGVGGLMLAGCAAYLVACVRPPGQARTLHWRDHAISLPPARAALGQFVLSGLHWASTAGVCWALLGGQVGYAAVLGALLLSAVAGVVTHVPGGLGVLEAVFIAMLQGQVAQGPLLGALLAFRALYYVVPLGVALPLFLWVDRRGAGAAQRAPAGASPRPTAPRPPL
ncbi:lysylphosphatidylglycerol synthase domain-containing protein [Ideonella sp.]|uniref:lysylphosphatidylglycerol synthase domain-containing protein n=1 Tax=Ideonella sp. TaxID=1929293 RepID=UPI0035B10EC6